jgi:hypothetical protein
MKHSPFFKRGAQAQNAAPSVTALKGERSFVIAQKEPLALLVNRAVSPLRLHFVLRAPLRFARSTLFRGGAPFHYRAPYLSGKEGV